MEKIKKIFSDFNNNNINDEKINLIKKNNTNLIKNIKINDVCRKLFSYMNKKRKLKSIKYNKELQNKLDITLNNYIFYS